MADPNTVNVGLLIPLHGSNVDIWDQPLNNNASAIDGLFAGVQSISVSNANFSLTAPSGSITPSGGPTQAQNAVLALTGTLTANVQITLPLPGVYRVDNRATGNFVITMRAVSSGEIIGLEPGACHTIYNNGTNVRYSDLPSIGTYHDFCDATVPTWITACTVPPYLNCNAGTFSGTTYPVLAQKLGSTTLPDVRGTVRAALNQGTGRITSASSNLNGDARFAVGGSQLSQAHFHAVNIQSQAMNQNQNHSHGINGGRTFALYGPGNGGAGEAAGPVYPGNLIVDSQNIDHVHQVSGNTDQALAGSSGNIPPTTIHGITLIRAG